MGGHRCSDIQSLPLGQGSVRLAGASALSHSLPSRPLTQVTLASRAIRFQGISAMPEHRPHLAPLSRISREGPGDTGRGGGSGKLKFRKDFQ